MTKAERAKPMDNPVEVIRSLVGAAKVYPDGFGLPVLDVHLMQREADSLNAVLDLLDKLRDLRKLERFMDEQCPLYYEGEETEGDVDCICSSQGAAAVKIDALRKEVEKWLTQP